MHCWGDEWFEKNGSDLYDAIKYIEDYLHKHHIGVCGKEKYGCYDASTEILTKNGWKHFDQLTNDDLVATLDNGYLTYTHPSDIQCYPYEGKMYHLVNRGVDIFVTDNHKLYVSKGSYFKGKKKNTYDFELVTPDVYFGKDKRFKKGCKWVGVKSLVKPFIIPSKVKFDVCKSKKGKIYERKHKYSEYTCELKTFLKFLGFYVAEGYIDRTSINIAHNPLSETDFVTNLIKEIGFVPHANKSNKSLHYFNSPQLSEWLKENCKQLALNKHCPEFVKNLPSEYIEIFLEYLYKGDGHKTNTSNILTTISKQLADDVCELLLKCGYTFKISERDRVNKTTQLKDNGRTIVSKHVVYEVAWLKNTEVEIEMSKVNKSKIDNFTEEYVDFKGTVYCVTVPNHVIYVRRNGKGYWCGNSYRDEYLHFWNGGIYEILFGYRGYIGTYHRYKCEWFKDFVDKIHNFIYFVIDEGHTINQREGESFEDYCKRYSNRKWKGLCHFNQKIGLTKFVNDIQAKYYNYAFQKACKKWPNVVDELIVMVDGYKMIKPCKYGDIDGEEIHKKYWIPIENTEKSEKNDQK